ncbi:MAG: IS630 family transposase, partial [Anderseniella sp.]
SNSIFDSYQDIVEAGCSAWNKLMAQPQSITSIGMRKWAHVGRS